MAESPLTMSAAHGAAMEPSPFGIESKKLVIWMFIIADAATFGAGLIVYAYLRVATPEWPRPFTFYPTIANALVMSVLLLTSSVTMLQALGASRRDDRPGTVRWIGITMLLGAVFVALHLREWSSMFKEGWSLTANPVGGAVQFGASFFTITGLELLHVVAGVVALGVVALKYGRGRLTTGHVECTGLYWHFVNLLWMFVFPLVYLLNAH